MSTEKQLRQYQVFDHEREHVLCLADSFYIGNGNLNVVRADTVIATFARGFWACIVRVPLPEDLEQLFGPDVFAAESVVEAELVPRTWESIANVPHDVKVMDPYGVEFAYDNGWAWGRPGNGKIRAGGRPDQYPGPFTEVIE